MFASLANKHPLVQKRRKTSTTCEAKPACNITSPRSWAIWTSNGEKDSLRFASPLVASSSATSSRSMLCLLKHLVWLYFCDFVRCQMKYVMTLAPPRTFADRTTLVPTIIIIQSIGNSDTNYQRQHSTDLSLDCGQGCTKVERKYMIIILIKHIWQTKTEKNAKRW